MSPLSNNNSTLSESSGPNNHSSANSAFKPLMMSSSASAAAAAAADSAATGNSLARQHSISAMSTSASDQYNSEMAYAGYNQISNSTQEYHAAQQQLPLFKREHDELAGYTYPRPVKLYDHSMEPYGTGASGAGAAGPHQNSGFRNDAPSPGASIIDLSTSSVVTSLRSQGFSGAAYYEGQRYDRSPQSASSPHYSSPQMLSPQGQTLDLSVGRTSMR